MEDRKVNNYIEDSKETDPLQSESKKVTQNRFNKKCFALFKNITVEPCLLLCIISFMISANTTQNLSIEKACRVNLNFTDEICTAMRMQELGTQNVYERQAQELMTTYIARKTYITATVPCLIALFAGAFQDKTGHRKIFQVIPLIGQFIQCISNMVNVYFFKQLPLQVLIFSEAFFESVSGGCCLLFLSAFSYVGTITTDENRTFRLGLVNLSITVGFPIGMAISGIVLKAGGYYVAYGLPASLHFLNILYNLFVLKDPERNKEQKEHDGQGFVYVLKIFFDPSHIRNTFGVICKKTVDNRTLRLILLMTVVCILIGPMYGEMSVLYLSTRYRFNWDEVQFSIFQTYNFVLHMFGTMFSIVVFSKILKWHDSIIGLLSCLSKTAAAFAYCFATTGTMFYIAPAVDLLAGTSLLALRSTISKEVEPNELGKVNSWMGLCENIMPLLYVSMYTQVYTATMDVLPGAVFLLSVVASFPAISVFVWLYVRHRRLLKMAKEEKKGTTF